MNAKELFKETQREIMCSIGLPSLDFLICSGNESNVWAYIPTLNAFNIPKGFEITSKQDEIDARFAIIHETSHMIQNFLLYSGINVQNVTKETLAAAITNFFGIENPDVSDEQVEKFNRFLDEYHLRDENLLKQLRFDDKFYVSGTEIKQFADDRGLMMPPNYIYTKNATEIVANHFAARTLFETMLQQNKPPEELQMLKNRIETHQYKGMKIQKDESEFKEQLVIRQYFKEDTLKERLSQMITREKDFKRYNFEASGKLLQQNIEDVDNIINEIAQNHKTQEQIQKEESHINGIVKEIEKEKYKNDVLIINNFEITAQTVQHCILRTTYGTMEQQAAAIKYLDNLHPNIKLIADLANKTNYLFTKQAHLESKGIEKMIEMIGKPTHDENIKPLAQRNKQPER